MWVGKWAQWPVFWSPDAKSWLLGKVPDGGKDWGQKEKRPSEDEMAGWNHRCNGHELGQSLGDGEGREAWCAAVHGIAKSRTLLCDWTTTTKWAQVSVFLHCVAPRAYPCHQQAETCMILFSNNDSVWPMWTSPPIHIYIGFCLARLCIFFMTGEHSGHYE